MPSDDITSPTGGEREERERTERVFPGRANDRGKALCAAATKQGKPCGALALGSEYGDDSDLCSGHAQLSKKTAEGERESAGGKRAGTARRERDLRAEIRSAMEDDADAILESVRKAIKEGRDVRALTSLLDRVYGDDRAIQVPSTLDEAAALSREERRRLMRQLEAELGIAGVDTTRQLLASEEEGMEESGDTTRPSAL